MRAIFQLPFLFFTLVIIQQGQALYNVTVDDQDASIFYIPQGSWLQTDRGTLDAGGQHMLTSNPDAYATFTFKGVAIYFMSPLWPYLVNTAITLDDGPLVLLDLIIDHNHADMGAGSATVKSQVVAKATGLEYTEHTIRISVGVNQPYAIVDSLIYTTGTAGEPISAPVGIPPTQFTPLSGNAPSVTSAPRRGASSLPPLSRTLTKSGTLALVLSIVLLIFALFLALGIWWCLFFIRNYPHPPPSQPKSIDSTLNGRDPPNTDTPTTSTYPMYSPLRFYQALRSLMHSPGREYPVEPVEEIEQRQRQEAGLGTPALSAILLFSQDAGGSAEGEAESPREPPRGEQWVSPMVPLAYVPTLRR